MTDPMASRRRFLSEVSLGLASLNSGSAISGGGITRITDLMGLTNPLTGWSLYNDVVTYSRLGEHRTATAVDVATANWMERHLLGLGFQTERQYFAAPQSFVKTATLLAGAHGYLPVEAFPLWPVTFTKAPLSRPLVNLQSDALTAVAGNIALVTFPYSLTGLTTPAMRALVEIAAAAGALALVAMTEGPTEQVTALNPLLDGKPLPIPVLLVGSKDQCFLEAAVNSGVAVTLAMGGSSDPAASASNVIGRLISHPTAPWIVISTPYSGWFRCGGERGPGIAYWRALSRWIVSRWRSATSPDLPLNYLFVATSGHELGQYGMTAFLQNGAPDPNSVPLWLHLGGWMASYAWSDPEDGVLPKRLKTENRRFLIAPHFNAAKLTPLSQLPAIKVQPTPFGELNTVLNAGYTYALTISGRNVPHHTRWDVAENTGPKMLEPVATALSKFMIAVESTSGKS